MNGGGVFKVPEVRVSLAVDGQPAATKTRAGHNGNSGRNATGCGDYGGGGGGAMMLLTPAVVAEPFPRRRHSWICG